MEQHQDRIPKTNVLRLGSIFCILHFICDSIHNDYAVHYEEISKNVSKPILANITEFGMTPLFPHNELAKAGVKIVLHPLSAFRAMSKAAEKVYATLASEGDHEGLLDKMQTRDDEVYKVKFANMNRLKHSSIVTMQNMLNEDAKKT